MKHFLTIILTSLVTATAFAAESGMHIQLRFKAPNGQYPTTSGVMFNVRVLSAQGGCILRDETFTNQKITDGNVSLTLGSGTRGSYDPNLVFAAIYDNTQSKANLTCVDANNAVTGQNQTYTPQSGDVRVLRVSTQVGSDKFVVNFSQRSVAYAYQADSALLAQSAANAVRAESATSAQSALTADHATTADTAASATTAVTALIAESLRGFSLSSASPSLGQVLAYDGTSYKPTTIAIPEIPEPQPVILAGDVTGASSETTVIQIGGKSAAQISATVDKVLAATSQATANTIAARDQSGNISAAALLATNVSAQNVSIYNVANSHKVQIKTLDNVNDYSITLPQTAGNSGEVLKTDGSGNLSWVSLPSLNGVMMQTTFNSYVASGNCSSGQTMYWNSVTSQFACQAISLPSKMDNTAAAVVAALGYAPSSQTIIVGTTSGTLAAGNDSRITGSLQQSTFNGYVANANCSATQALYWNNSTQTFACQTVSVIGLPSGSQVTVPIQNSPTAAGSTTAYIVSYGSSIDSKITTNTVGDSVRFKVAQSNTATATLKVGHAPAAPLYSEFTGMAVQAGDLQLGYHQATYDGTNWIVSIPPRRIAVTGLSIAADALQTIRAAGIREGDSVHCALTLGAGTINAANRWTTAVVAVADNIQVMMREDGKPGNVTGITCTVQK